MKGARHNVPRDPAGADTGSLRERAISIAEQDLHIEITLQGDRQIWYAVAVDVSDGSRKGRIPGGVGPPGGAAVNVPSPLPSSTTSPLTPASHQRHVAGSPDPACHRR
jgi:hypothetical protein